MDTAHTICPADILGNGIMVPPLATSTSKSSRIKSSPQAEETTTYHGVQRQDINETLSQQYRDLLEAAAIQGDGYPCAECDQVLKTRAIWMEHMKGVHMNRKYACQYCGETFKWRSSRKRHVLMSHRNEKDLDLSIAT
ncbi:hypothetical protein LSH36_578g01036 [Paralvinella palmiformis]|uniref:C2H2-type domain-containing protein n=1 Tax=Paralvinella palmiformis TaxID=53620 RepID=A0AAD9MXT8_9ANNE|nr:hypothetical protein LSH36_578g01036 [Paralvinella palmiformis]